MIDRKLDIQSKIIAYKKKYYLSRLLKGVFVGLGVLSGMYLAANLVEYQLRFNTTGRTILFFILLSCLLLFLIKYIAIPFRHYLTANRQLSNEEAASQIGKYFPNISDKLLNIIQLHKDSASENSLVAASIEQKTDEIGYIPFTEAINIKENLHYLKYPLAILVVIVGLFLVYPELIKGSTTRIIRYQETFVPEAPFSFKVLNNSLSAFKNESLTINLLLEGESIPDRVKLLLNNTSLPMVVKSGSEFQYTFDNLDDNLTIQFEAAGFKSQPYQITVIERPLLQSFLIDIDYPAYLSRISEQITGTGNIEVPEGSKVNWQMDASNCDSAFITIHNSHYEFSKTDDETFMFNKRVLESSDYNITLKNSVSTNKEAINYTLAVIKDQFPQIRLSSYQDTVLYDRLFLGGIISDDYGLLNLRLHYRITGDPGKYSIVNIPISKNANKQSFGYEWILDSLTLKSNDRIQYYLSVWDNDGINGSKSSKTAVYELSLPSETELSEKLEDSKKSTESTIKESLSKAKDLKSTISEINKDLKGKKRPDWQDKKNMDELLKKREEVKRQIEKLKEEQKKLTEQNKKFGNPDEKIVEKTKKLQQLMNELLDEETKKLYDELKKLLEKNNKSEDFQQLLDKLENKEENLENEIDRALEMFKQMKLDMKLSELNQQLTELAKKEEELSEKTLDKKQDLDQLKKEQEDIDEEFEDIKKDLDKADSLNKELERPNDLDNFDNEEENIENSLDDAKEQLNDNNRKKASESQKKAGQQMKEMQGKMKAMMAGMQEENMQEDISNLKQILNNLIRLSFEQERIMVDFANVKQSDPRFISLSQEQLKLERDSKIVMDSLYALAKRVDQLTVFVTREASKVQVNLEKSIVSIKERKKNEATVKQQLSLTSINNLALMLDNVLSSMQSQMSAGGSSNKKGKKKPSSAPGLSELQKQLNQQISDLKKSGKTGRQLSEELGKLAAQQEMIRQKLREMEKFLEGQNGKSYGNNGQPSGEGGEKEGKEDGKKAGNLNDLKKQMEETEMDLVRKRITEETIARQKKIMTRLLEAENSLREKELDKKREAKQPEESKISIPPSFEEYLKKKEKEIELLKTVPLKLNTFYKKEVDAYFDRIEK